MDKFKEIMRVIHRLKVLIFLGVLFFTYYSYAINAVSDYKGFLITAVVSGFLLFTVMVVPLIFIKHFIATIIYVVVVILYLFSINLLTNTTEYLYKKALDPCHKIDNVRWIGKGPWQYELNDRICIGKRYGDTIIYKTR